MKLKTLAFVVAAFVPATLWAQPPARSLSNPPALVLPGVGPMAMAAEPATRPRVPEAVMRGLATMATGYKFISVDYPGASFSTVYDENASIIVGNTEITNSSRDNAFIRSKERYQLFNVPGALSTWINAINSAGDIVGYYYDSSNGFHGFLDKGGAITLLDDGRGDVIQPEGINDAGEITGTLEDPSGASHGFYSLDGVNFVTFDPPGSRYTIAFSANASGIISGTYSEISGKFHGFILNHGTYTVIDAPHATSTTLTGINDSNAVSGYYVDGTDHGFVYSRGQFAVVDVLGAVDTQLQRIKNNGDVLGIYVDALGEWHGLRGRFDGKEIL